MLPRQLAMVFSKQTRILRPVQVIRASPFRFQGGEPTVDVSKEDLAAKDEPESVEAASDPESAEQAEDEAGESAEADRSAEPDGGEEPLHW